jgi:hypothetical protein
MCSRWLLSYCASLVVACFAIAAAPPAPPAPLVTSFATAPQGPSAKAPASSTSHPDLEQAIEQLTKEANSLETIHTSETIKLLARPHPAVAGLKQTTLAQLAERICERFTGNELKDTYIRYHLIYPLTQADRTALAPLAGKLVEMVKYLPVEMTFDSRPQVTFDPPDIGKRYEEVESRCRVVIGFPPFERTVHPPESFQHKD